MDKDIRKLTEAVELLNGIVLNILERQSSMSDTVSDLIRESIKESREEYDVKILDKRINSIIDRVKEIDKRFKKIENGNLILVEFRNRDIVN